MLTIPDSHRDLLAADVATLATIGPDGYPQLSEVWFLVEGDDIRLSLNTSRQKVKNLERRPACGLLILDPANAGRYLEVRGDAEFEADPDYEFAEKVASKYGADLRARDKPGESRAAVTIRPVRVRAWG